MKNKRHLLLIIIALMVTLTLKAQEGLKVNLKEVHAIGNELHLDYLVTSQEADADVSISFRDTKLYDDQGNVYSPQGIIFGQESNTYGAVSQKCIQDIPMKMTLVFTGAPSKLKSVKAIMFNLHRKVDAKDFSIKQMDISIPKTEDKLILAAQSDPLLFEIVPGVFAHITKAERKENKIFISFLVTNSKSDREVGFGFRNTRIIDNLGNSINLKKLDFAGTVKTYGGANLKMPQGVPMKLIYEFDLSDVSATFISIFEFSSGDNVFQLKVLKF